MQIIDALRLLNPSDDALWTIDGLPLVDIVSELVGRAVKRQEIINAAPGFTRASAPTYFPAEPAADVLEDGEPLEGNPPEAQEAEELEELEELDENEGFDPLADDVDDRPETTGTGAPAEPEAGAPAAAARPAAPPKPTPPDRPTPPARSIVAGGAPPRSARPTIPLEPGEVDVLSLPLAEVAKRPELLELASQQLERAMTVQRKAKAAAEDEIARLSRAIEVLDSVRQRIAPKRTETGQAEIQAFLKATHEARAAKVLGARRFLAGQADPKAVAEQLSPLSKIDSAMARKSGRGNARPRMTPPPQG